MAEDAEDKEDLPQLRDQLDKVRGNPKEEMTPEERRELILTAQTADRCSKRIWGLFR